MSQPKSPTPTSQPDSDLSGRALGDYQLLRRLDTGGMADVYLAQQRSLRRQVAVKVLKRALADDEAYVRRFQREAHAVAALSHASIVQIYEVGCIEQIHFLAQEYVAGVNLRQWVVRNGPADVRMAVTVIRQVAAALAGAARAGIVHRDIKPDNILIAPDGAVKVADFGLARLVDQPDGMSLTQAGMTMGTPLYMSPEQIEGHALDPRSDIYSLGVTCYFMLAGEVPFQGETALNVAVQHLQTDPRPLATVRPDLPAALSDIVHRMLAKKAADRYQHASDVLTDLRRLRGELPDRDAALLDDHFDDAALAESRPVATEAIAKLQQAMTASANLRRRLVQLLPAALVAVVLFAAGSAVAWWNRSPPLLVLSEEEERQAVERKNSAAAQYAYAVIVDTEQAWKSVERHFPPEDDPQNRLIVNRARRHLGWWYVDNDRLAEAAALFERLASLGPAEQEFQAHGLAGLAVVLGLQDDPRAADHFDDVLPLLEHLDETERTRLAELFGPLPSAPRPPSSG